MNNEDLINIINYIEHPEIPLSLKELGILSFIKFDDSIVTVIFALPDLSIPNRKDIANSVRIMAESFGYKFEYDFRKMSVDENKKYLSLLK